MCIRDSGRPGWHLECSVMSEKFLGKNFDIHGGGLDLIFPHHENEIAQSCCANKVDKFANYWLHNGYVTFNKEKMSKSLGNIVTIEKMRKTINGQVIRFALLSSHYKQPLDWNENLLSELSSPKYSFTSSGKIKIESKSDMKARGLKSPDMADALTLSLSGDAAIALHGSVGAIRWNKPIRRNLRGVA